MPTHIVLFLSGKRGSFEIILRKSYTHNLLNSETVSWVLCRLPNQNMNAYIFPSLSVCFSLTPPAVRGTELQAIKAELTQIKTNIEALLGRLEQITEDPHITTTGERHTQVFTS